MEKLDTENLSPYLKDFVETVERKIHEFEDCIEKKNESIEILHHAIMDAVGLMNGVVLEDQRLLAAHGKLRQALVDYADQVIK